MTAPLNLDALEAAARAATPGPWHAVLVEGDDSAYPSDGYHVYADSKAPLITDDYAPGEADATYIAASNPAVVLELVARLRAAEADAASQRAKHHELAKVSREQQERYAAQFSPVNPTMEGQIMMAASTMRNGRLYHAVREISQRELMLARDGGVALAEFNGVFLLGAIKAEVPNAHS